MMTDAAAEAEAVEHFTKVAKDNFGSGDRIRFAHAADGDDAIPQVRKFLGGEHLKVCVDCVLSSVFMRKRCFWGASTWRWVVLCALRKYCYIYLMNAPRDYYLL